MVRKNSPRDIVNRFMNKENKDDVSMDFGNPDMECLSFLRSSFSSTQLSDAMSKTLGYSGVVRGVRSINFEGKIFGRILTVRTGSDDWGTCLLGIDEAEPGEVLFIYTGDLDGAVWGELTSTESAKRGIQGTVIYGATRDVDALKFIDYPVFALGNVPNAGLASGLGEIRTSVIIDDHKISDGDFAFGDENGLVVIPQDKFELVVRKTLEIKEGEKDIISQLELGASLSEITGLK